VDQLNTNDVCTAYPALSMVRDGYEVQVVADGGGSPGVMAVDIALRRMEKAGVTRAYLRQLRGRATFESTSHRPHWVESTAESGRSQAPAKLWRFSLGPWEISARH
jgi:hypothetical protein